MEFVAGAAVPVAAFSSTMQLWRLHTIARGEALEAFAALETAALIGEANPADVERCLRLTDRLYALLTGLIR